MYQIPFYKVITTIEDGMRQEAMVYQADSQ
jgi:hypothetical protein